MKYGRVSAAAIVLATTFAAPAAAQATVYDKAVLADDPLTYLRMQAAAGGTVQDASANNRHGVLTGGATLSPLGPFVAAGDALQLAQDGALGASVTAQSRSLEMWVNPGRLRRGEQAGFAAHGDPAGDGWAVGVGAKRKLTFVTGGVKVASKVSLPSGVWSMLHVTWDAGKVRFVVNGGATAKQATFSTVAPASADGGMVLGGTGRGAFSGAFGGRMDEVALYGKVLTSDDMREHFAASLLAVNTAPVVVGGAPVVGSPIVATPGVWTGATTAPTYQWQRCDAEGDECDDIEGATSATYVVTTADACSTLRVVETVSSASGSTTTVSEPSAVVPGPCPGDTGGETGTGDTGGETGTGTGEKGSSGTDATDVEAWAMGTPVPTRVTTGATGATGATGSEVAGIAAAGAAGATATAAAAPAAKVACLKLVSGRRTVKLRGLGTLRLRTAAGGCIRSGAPLRLSFAKAKGKQVRSVGYRLGGKVLKVGKRRGHAVAVTSARLSAGKRVLKVRVAPRRGKARTVTLKLRFAKA